MRDGYKEYILIVSHSHKFICLQPWKVASSTLYKRLKQYDSGEVPQYGGFDEKQNVVIHKHIPLDVAVRLSEWRDDYFRFVFVRNPYDRIYSGFGQRKFRISRIAKADLSSRDLEEHRILNLGFDAFLEYQRALKERNAAVIGGELHSYIYHENALKLDYVGSVEQFEASFAKVCGLIGVPPFQASSGNVAEENVKLNGNVRFKGSETLDAATLDEARYRYLDKFTPQGIECVNVVYREDFELLGYRRLDPAIFEASPDAYSGVSPVSAQSILRDYAPVPAYG